MAASLQKSKVCLQFLWTAVQDAIGQGYRRGDACRVLIDIKGRVKMRYSQAFDVELIVNHKAWAEVSIQKAAINFSENFQCERSAIFLNLVHLFFEFRKHRLAE